MTMTNPVVKLDKPGADPITEDLEGWKVVEGNPAMKTWVQHASTDGSMISGTWEATPGSYHATYNAYEFVHLIEDASPSRPTAPPVTVGPGDAFVVEAGFTGVWKIEEPVRKHFDIKLK